MTDTTAHNREQKEGNEEENDDHHVHDVATSYNERRMRNIGGSCCHGNGSPEGSFPVFRHIKSTKYTH